MATLIQSKQIEGVVTASVIHGEFLVSGSLIVTGSNSILGSVTASTISSSFVGDGSGITNITYSQIENTPQFVGGNNITITSSSNVITVHAQLDGTGSDAQSLSISGDQLTILGGNTVTIPTGSGVSDYTQLTNVPSGIISGSSQITITQSQISDLSHTDISLLNTFSGSIQSEVDSLTAATSSYLTELPSGVISGSSQVESSLPAGVISGSSQITITESQISDLSHYGDSDVKTKLDTEGVLSGSLVSQLPSGVISGSEQLPSGLVSGSSQITITQSQITDLSHTDISALNTFSSSIQSEVDSLTSATSSYLTTVPSGTISGSEQLPQGLISGSSQITITESQISDLSHYTNSDVQSYIDSIGVVSGSVVAELPSGVISGSSQLPSGVISGSSQVVDSLPSGTVSGSSQITITESQISDLSHTQIPSGTISGSEQLPSGLVSGSTQVVDSLPSGVVSGSSQITITESQISDLSHTDISSLNTFTSSIQSEVDSLTAATSSYLTSISSGIVSSSAQVTELLPSGIISGSTQLPAGLVSGSTQITDGSEILSGSLVEQLPSGVISGSTQLPSGLVSGSFSSSVSDNLVILNDFSASHVVESASLDLRLDAVEGNVGWLYDLSNTVWNNVYIKSGSSGVATAPNGFETNNLPFKFTLNEDAKLYYGENHIVYIQNFDRDTRIVAQVSSSYETGSREVGLTVLEINGESGPTRINDSYWVLTRHTAGFVPSSSYADASASFDQRISVIVSSGSGADWNVNLTNIPRGIISGSQQLLSESLDVGLALTSSLNEISNSLDTKIENVYLSSSNFDSKTLVSGSSQIDLRNVTNYVADEHIDHTTVLINAGDGLDGGGDISNSRTLSLNITSSHFEGGVTDILTSEGVVKTSTLNDDLVGTDFSQSVDSRIDAIVASTVPAGTVSGSQQVDIEQTTNFTSFSSSIATSIAGVSGGTTDISALNTFTSSADTRITNLENFSSSLDSDFATDTEVTNLSSSLSQSIYEAAQSGSGVSSWSELSDIPQGIISGSTFTNFSQSIDSRVDTEKERIDNILSGANADYDQFVEIVDLVNSTDTTNDIAFANHYTSSRQRLSSLESFTSSLDATYATDIEVNQATASLSASLSQSIYEASLSGSSIDTSMFATTGSNTFSGSQFLTGSIIPEASGGNGLHDLGSTSNPFRELYITTGSVRFVKDGSVVSRVSGEENAIRVGEVLITTASIQQPIGLISGSIVGSGSVSVTSGSGVITISSTGGGASSWSELSGIPSNLVSSSEQIASDISGAFYAPSASIAEDIASLGGGTFDGNRVVSNELLPSMFSSSFNPGTSGSLVDFINAIFYPNSGPSISTGNQTIAEYVESGSSIVTLSGSDPEGQAITFGTASDYTDDLVRVESGVLKLNALAESSSFNTDLTGGSHGHEVTITATDTFGTVTEKDIYIFVTPNSAPVFRETSTSGNVITSVTANLNENSTNDTLVKRVYFTDTNSDTITITTGSIDNNHFDVTIYGTYLDIRQNTGSLDYEQQTQYTFSITASDEHFEAGQDSDSVVYLPITINVTDNLVPTVSDQTLSSINENSSNGATVGSISAADNEGDTITFKNFELHQLQLDGSEVTSGSYSGTSQLTDPHENPFQMSSSGVVTRKTGVYLNSDLINRYIYRAQVTDSYNGDSNVALITINITDDTPATLSDNWSAGPYIKESEESGATMKTTNYGSAAADYDSNQVGTWSSSNPAISINSNGNLLLGVDLSGSVTQSGDTLDSTITFTNTFGTTTTDSLSVTIVGNSAPTATFSNSGLTGNYNTNLATDGTALLTSTVSDTESDTPYQMTIGGTNGSSFTAVPQNSDSSSWQIQANGDLSAGSYSYDVTVTDSYSETTTYSRSLTIAQGDTGTLGGDTTSYIIESAESGDSLRDATGYNQGNTSQLSVSYTNYGSPTVQSYTSSNEAFNIDTSGNITLALDISGSSTGSGDTISSDITFVDQYGNIGSGSLTVNVFANGAPTATFTDNSSYFNTNQATGSVSLVDVSITDTEGDTPYVLTLGGTNGSSLSAVPQNVNSSSYEIQPASDLSAGTYTYDVTVTDNFGKSTTYSGRTITIAAADTGDLVSTDAYIIESAVSGDLIRRNSNGRTGTQSSVAVSYSPSYGSPVASNFASSNALIDIDSAGRLSVGNDISGSGQTNGALIATTISWTDQYGNNGSEAISVDVTQNFAPTVSSTSTSNLNTNQATGSSLILRLNLTDTESDTINASGLSWTGYNSTYFQPSNTTGQMNLLVNNTSVPAGEYDYTASIEDVHGFSTNVVSGSYTIAQADNGTLGGDTSIYIIESAESGDVFRDATGYNNGNAAQVSVSYSPSYGSPVVTEFTSSNAAISIDSSGNLTLGLDLSGSVTQSGDTIESTITFRDQYDNIGSGSVTATVFGNSAPSATFVSASSYDTDASVSGSTAGTLTVTDTENNSPFTFTLAGTDGGKFNVAGSSSPFTIQPTGSLEAGSYSINITVTDNYGESVTLTNESIVVDAAEVLTNIYVYTLPQLSTGATYNNATGITAESSDTPPVATIATTYGFFTAFVDADTLGDSTITVSYGTNYTATRRAILSGSNVDAALDSVGMSIGSSERVFIMIPSGSTMGGVPTSFDINEPGSSTTVGEYVLYLSNQDAYESSGTGNDIKPAKIHKLTLDTSVDGYSDWFVVGSESRFNSGNNNLYVRMVPSSGSTPS